MKEKTTISEKLVECRRLLSLAEDYAYDGFYDESNMTWTKASELAVSLIKDYPVGYFLEDEYTFLKSIINHIKEED